MRGVNRSGALPSVFRGRGGRSGLLGAGRSRRRWLGGHTGIVSGLFLTGLLLVMLVEVEPRRAAKSKVGCGLGRRGLWGLRRVPTAAMGVERVKGPFAWLRSRSGGWARSRKRAAVIFEAHRFVIVEIGERWREERARLPASTSTIIRTSMALPVQ